MEAGAEVHQVARAIRSALGAVLGVIARLWLATLRLDVVAHERLRERTDRPWVFAFFHGTQWPLLAWPRRRRTLVMVSWSLDGTLQARALKTLGFDVVRGSTSRGGSRALAAMARTMRRGAFDAAFAVDGPRGPYGAVSGGAMLIARASGAVVVPMGSAFSNGRVLHRAWDRFGLAWPFSRVVVSLGAPIEPTEADPRRTDALAAAIRSANLLAHARLGDPSASSVPAPGKVTTHSGTAGAIEVAQ